MTTKLILGVVFVAISSLLGLKVADKYNYRRQVFQKLYDFSIFFNSKVGFINETVKQSLVNLQKDLPQTLENVNEFFEGEQFECRDKKLTVKQKELVSSFINSLGISDSKSQKNLNNSYIELIKNELTSVKTYAQKFTQLSVKLGFAFGLVIFIILI